jgi:hypothetical protein
MESFRLTLWRYGREKEFVKLLGWHDEHGPQAMRQILPDGDFTQTGAGWNRTGFTNPHISQMAVAPERSGLYYFHAETESGQAVIRASRTGQQRASGRTSSRSDQGPASVHARARRMAHARVARA